MDAYVSLAIIIVVLLVGLIAFVVYKESGWKLVKEDEKKDYGHRGHDYEERERERWRREREERWRRERERERDRYR